MRLFWVLAGTGCRAGPGCLADAWFHHYALFQPGVFPMTYPNSLGQWLALATAVLLSWLVSFTYRFLLNLAAFWTPNAKGISRFGYVVSWFFSGFLMPLRLFPEWVHTIASWTPFPHMLNTVVEIYIGTVQGTAVWYALFLQAIWAVGLAVAGQLLLKTAVRRLVILGG
jgi:ABC-2 type transport system permease protein